MPITLDDYIKIFKELRKKYYENKLSHHIKFTESDSYDALAIELFLCGEKFNLKIELPRFFPSELPRIYFKNPKEIFKNIPHVDDNGFICTFDSNEIVNETDPVKLIDAVIQKAKEILRNSFDNEYKQEEFKKEFLRYWRIDSDRKIKFFLLCNLVKSHEELNLLYAYYQDICVGYIYRDEYHKEVIKELLGSLKQPIEMKAVVVKSTQTINPYGKLVKDVYNLASKEMLFEKKIYYNIGEKYLFISYFENNGSKIVFGWSPKLENNEINGFRKNKIPLEIVLQKNSNQEITKIYIESINKERLFGRIGDNSKRDEHIAILGCGSLGSYTLRALIDVGYSNFDLVDNDILCAENIARHLCGFNYLDNSKVDALKHYFNITKPYIEIQEYNKHALEYINEDKINKRLFIIAIGNYNIEKKIDDQLKGDKIFLWTEPYSLACHALFIPNKSPYKFGDLFDENYKFRESVIKNDIILEESGCGTTFMPYNINNFNNFISLLSYDINKIMKEEYKEAKLFSGIYLRFYEEIKKLITKEIRFEISDAYKDVEQTYLVRDIKELLI